MSKKVEKNDKKTKKETELKAKEEESLLEKMNQDNTNITRTDFPIEPTFTKTKKKKRVKTAVLLVNEGQGIIEPCKIIDSEFFSVGSEKNDDYKEYFYHVQPTLLAIDKSLITAGRRNKDLKGFQYLVLFFAKEYEPITRRLTSGKTLGSIADQQKKKNKLIELGVAVPYPSNEYTEIFGEKARPPLESYSFRIHPDYAREFEIYDVSDIDMIKAEVKNAMDHRMANYLVEAMAEEFEKDPNAFLGKVLWWTGIFVLGMITGFLYVINEMSGKIGYHPNMILQTINLMNNTFAFIFNMGLL